LSMKEKKNLTTTEHTLQRIYTICVYTCTHVYIYIYTHTYIPLLAQQPTDGQSCRGEGCTVSCPAACDGTHSGTDVPYLGCAHPSPRGIVPSRLPVVCVYIHTYTHRYIHIHKDARVRSSRHRAISLPALCMYIHTYTHRYTHVRS
jgi:hypothetical protein